MSSGGAKFKKVRISQGLGRLESSRRVGSFGNMFQSMSNIPSTHTSGSNSGNTVESTFISPLTTNLTENPDPEGHGNPTSPTTPLTPNSESSTPNLNIDSTAEKRGVRGASRGINLDKIIKRHGKIKIAFNPRERISAQNEDLYSEGIGVAAHAQLADVSWWRQIPETNKEKCRKRLLDWFEIEDWNTERVQKLVDQMFQDCYRHWRNRLANYYKEFVRKGKNPREKSPRSEVTDTTWVKVCDWLESTKFKDRSLVNSTNRSKLHYNHTSGNIRVLTRYRKMANPSKVEIWRTTHVDKTGQFVNPTAAALYDKMVELEDKSMEEGETPMSEDEILAEALGHRSGYQKGMGYGVEVAPRGKSSSSTTQQDSQVNEKLSETQNKLENAETKIRTLTIELEEQKERNKNNEEKIETLQAQMQQMQQLWLRMQGNNTTPNCTW
ncbi:hypothetical protein ACJIZ3_023830 [Penstemon smallii]|uniref:Transposase, Ptta/En/Spm, plant n=1 Tax=Penstemon smallii TaxID=265156 RepID=A0ABD3TQ53_9LAMI